MDDATLLEEAEENKAQASVLLADKAAIAKPTSPTIEAVKLDPIIDITEEIAESSAHTSITTRGHQKVIELTDSASAFYSLATWLVVSLFVVIQLVIIEQAVNGPFFDEAIYVTAGFRTLDGFGISDRYTTWFAGSLIWPVMAAFGYKAGGLLGVRLLALLCTSLALSASVKAAANLFGRKAGFWTAISFAVSGPTLALAHLGTYDVVALAGMGVSFWAITELYKHDDRRWLVLATLAFSLSVLAKYPIGLCIIPLVALIYGLRGNRARLDTGILGFISLAILLIYYLLLREQVEQFLPWRLENNPSFGATPTSIWTDLLYVSFVPLLLAGAGWIALRKNPYLATVLWLTLLIWPIYHLMAGNVVSANKHVVFGFLFAYPLIGIALATLARRWLGTLFATLCLLGLTAFGYVQMTYLDSAWPDVRSSAQYLTENVQPGARLLINDSWPFTMYLYTQGRIDEPWKVYDTYRVQHDAELTELCDFDWLVNEEGIYSWPETILAKIKACGTFKEVYTTTSYTNNLTQNFQVITKPVPITIWHNSKGEVKP